MARGERRGEKRERGEKKGSDATITKSNGTCRSLAKAKVTNGSKRTTRSRSKKAEEEAAAEQEAKG